MARLLDLLNEDETPETVETTEVQGELEVSDGTSEPEAEEVEAVDEEKDFEFDLEDEPEIEKPKFSAQDALVHKLSLKNKKFKEAKTELEAANQRIAELEAKSAQPVSIPEQPHNLREHYGYPPVPVMYENGVNSPADYQLAFQDWEAERRKIDVQRAQVNTQNTQFEEVKRSRLARLGEDAERFFETNKINPERGSDYIANAAYEIDSQTQVEGSFAQLLEAVGEGSAAIAYHLGSKSTKGIAALAKVKSLLARDAGGLQALSYLKDLQRDLTPKNRKNATDLEPDEALKGGGNTLKASGLQRKYDEETDFTKLRAIMREAKSLGIELKSS